ncbi:hypothetical protein DFH07DRAFT_1014232 [Mycena maculata]|uniref:Uncharacterized protein n=1 Tax=Mycena maculata TaxID=230809 RepID=A0AAD7NL67_9AGAR|nr:hypothetical protein DFH07DRAFT_1014232 [Mycena maculata]
MKFSMTTILTALCVTRVASALSDARAADAAAECGDLGAMTVNPDELPKDVQPTDVRKCADHPLGHVHPDDESLAPMNETLKGVKSPVGDACYYGAPYGCSGGYCWEACGVAGDGQWCWMASKGGWGSWDTCETYADCGAFLSLSARTIPGSISIHELEWNVLYVQQTANSPK